MGNEWNCGPSNGPGGVIAQNLQASWEALPVYNQPKWRLGKANFGADLVCNGRLLQFLVAIQASDFFAVGIGLSYSRDGHASFHIITKHLKTSIAANTGFMSTYTIEFATLVLEKLKIKCTQVMIATALDTRSKSFLGTMHIDKQAVTDKDHSRVQHILFESIRFEWT